MSTASALLQPKEVTSPKKQLRSTLVSRNVTVAGHRTSIRLEPEMWSGLSEMCRRERTNLHEICTYVGESKHEDTSLTAAIRVYIMNYYRVAASEEGHAKAGHGSIMRMASAPIASANSSHTPNTVARQPQAQPMMQSAPVQRAPVTTGPFMIGMGRMNSNGTIR